MADLKKFLDQSGVSTLWTRVAEEVSKVNTKVLGVSIWAQLDNIENLLNI